MKYYVYIRMICDNCSITVLDDDYDWYFKRVTQFWGIYKAYDTSESFLGKSVAQVTFVRKLAQVTFATAP